MFSDLAVMLRVLGRILKRASGAGLGYSIEGDGRGSGFHRYSTSKQFAFEAWSRLDDYGDGFRGDGLGSSSSMFTGYGHNYGGIDGDGRGY
jgi:hypothetical protein